MLVSFTHLAGVPVHWGSWGATGTRQLDSGFKAILEQALYALWSGPWGTPAAILSGGAYVAGRDPTTDRHGDGTAFDLSGFDWPNGPGKWTVTQQWHSDPKTTLGMEAVLRQYIPQVLGPWYDADHQTHFHLDGKAAAAGYQSSSTADNNFKNAAKQYVLGAAATPTDWSSFLSATAKQAGFSGGGIVGLLLAGLLAYFVIKRFF